MKKKAQRVPGAFLLPYISDIETGSTVDEQSVREWIKPFKAFDEDAVKKEFVTARDPVKGPGFIANKREAHELAEATYYHDAAARGALSAVTGELLIIGVMTPSKEIAYFEGSEYQMLVDFWKLFSRAQHGPCRIIGWNWLGFDLPFLVQRSWRHGIAVPEQVFDGRYASRVFIDLMKHWACGAYGVFEALDRAGRFLGAPGKATDVDGESFAAHWRSGDPERKAACYRYLDFDLLNTRTAAERMLAGMPFIWDPPSKVLEASATGVLKRDNPDLPQKEVC